MILASNERLSLLIRKNSGKHKLGDYKQFFKGFNLKELVYVDLEQSDQILGKIESAFSDVEKEFEMIKNEPSNDSQFLKQALSNVDGDDTCYIFTDEADQCGMFISSTKSALQNCLNIAFLAYNNACFLTDCEFKFSLVLSYNDDDDRDYPNTFEIQRSMIKK